MQSKIYQYLKKISWEDDISDLEAECGGDRSVI